jgi:hypothetical protein
MSLLSQADNKFKDMTFDSVKVHHGGYDSVLFFTVAVLRQGTTYHVAVARTNIGAGDQFSRPKGRKIALGRALQQAASAAGKASARLNATRMYDNAVTIVAGPETTPVKIATEASLSLGESIPAFLFKENL